ncbi:hypothetical protein HYALB_00003815 [Hymenoscyphus albidus]|uniref:Yippee domain-containing protein n=1 Tax=Hymenoscyphus albidus TaxID=595503 RepID=A0A9N9QB84_9HELO|nr:hypothetical protein HYALB_00003815 [Hymenoscyphus albidus]
MAPDRPPFPTYLLPSFPLPFRQRHSSTTSTTSTSSEQSLSASPSSSATTTPSSSPPNPHYIPSFLTAHSSLTRNLQTPKSTNKPHEPKPTLHRTAPNTLKCITCASDLAFTSQIVSKGFTGRHGRAYLVAPPPSSIPALKKFKPTQLINTRVGRSVNRDLLTGAHVVADVTCTICGTVLGWKYVDAKELAQKYKIGKYILEMKRVVVGVSWEVGKEDGEANELGECVEVNADAVVFDSEDEDECEKLFEGIWDPDIVAKRRARKVGLMKKGGGV